MDRFDKSNAFIEDKHRLEVYQGSSSKPLSMQIGYATEVDISKQRDEEIAYEITYITIIEKLKQEFDVEREKLLSLLTIKDKQIGELKEDLKNRELLYQNIIAHRLIKIVIMVSTITILGWIVLFLYR